MAKHRQFDGPRPDDKSALIISEYHKPKGNQRPQALPVPPGESPYRMDLEDVIGAGAISAIKKAGQMVFHTVGDTGAVKRPEVLQIVANHMKEDFAKSVAPVDRPSFFYHLGDVVYYFGSAGDYPDQFYEPYSDYPAPIIAIPGNHDGDIDPNQPAPSLSAYMNNFCAPEPVVTEDTGEAARHAMTQPNPYFTLETPLATIIGMYTNVPEGGYVDSTQQAWLAAELKAADRSRAVIVALHHPMYSADAYHGGSKAMGDILDQAVKASGAAPPNLVLTAHVHNYQRFTRTIGKREVPYLVAGGGGYWNLHKMAKQLKTAKLPLDTPEPGIVLETYCSDRHGYLRITVTKKTIHGEYFTVPRPQESWKGPVELFDAFEIELGTYHVQTLPTNQSASAPDSETNSAPAAHRKHAANRSAKKKAAKKVKK